MYVIAVTGSCVFTTCGLIYFFDKEYAVLLTKQIGWNTMKAYTYCEKMVEDNIIPIFNQQFPLLEYYEYYGYNLEKNEGITLFENPGEYYDIIFFIEHDGKKKYYKRMEENDNEEMNKIDKQFLQIEIEIDEEKKEIQSHFDPFYIEGNVLDHTFFKWYMKYWYSTDLKDDYKLHIIDNSVNVFQIDCTQKIIFEDNKYVIKDI